MKKTHILHIALIALLFSACSSFNRDSKTPQNSESQQAAAQNNSRFAGASAQTPPEEKSNGKLDNAFANLDEEPIDDVTSKSVPPQRNEVCPIPDKPCHHQEKEFAEWELPFQLPSKITPNKTYSSAPFYAVLLKTYKSEEDCDGGEFIIELENERKQFQNMQLERKVFASYGCPNMDAVSYDFEGRHDDAKEMVLIDNFIAVYAGATEEEAEVLRRSVRDEYPEAVVKRMTVRWERIEQ